MFGCCLVQLTSLTGRLLGLRRFCRGVTLVAWKRYKTRLNRALRLLDASLTLLGAFWTPLGSFWTPRTPFGYHFHQIYLYFFCTFCIHFKSLIFASTLNCYFMDFDAIDTLKITFLLQFYNVFSGFGTFKTMSIFTWYFMDSGMLLDTFWHTFSRLVQE